MPDRETVIEKLNDMADYLLTKSYSDLLARDFYDTVGYAIALLEEQKPVEVDTKTVGMPNGCDIEVYCCRNCRFPIDISFHYCPNCGQEVKWDE